jgi:hypothetical protein
VWGGPAVPAGGARPTPIRVEPRTAPTVVVAPRTPLTVRPAEVTVVEAPPRGAWDDRGWVMSKRNGHPVYQGHYQIIRRRTGRQEKFAGRVEAGPGRATAFIENPPPEVRTHPKAPCFRHISGGWFKLDWYRPASNVDDAILYMERILDQAVNK